MRALFLVVSVAGAAVLSAGVARAQADRYGPDQTADQQVATLDGPYLTWPGKQAPSDVGAATQPQAPAEQPAPAPEPPVAAPAPPPVAEEPETPAVAALPAVLPAPQPAIPPAAQPLAVAQPTPVPAPQPAAQATAPAAPLAPQQTAEDAGHARLPPHIYSVARDYGLKPDPIPLTNQFFQDQSSSDTDLAAPPPALPPRPVPGAQTVNNPSNINTPSNRARAVAEDTPSPDDDSSN
ncbi:MAG TPA: hypothetical protein VN805_12850 [Caulobacteraceae bacterium]|nr:hypothetical protein [Caulobacteraceae bacterium]